MMAQPLGTIPLHGNERVERVVALSEDGKYTVLERRGENLHEFGLSLDYGTGLVMAARVIAGDPAAHQSPKMLMALAAVLLGFDLELQRRQREMNSSAPPAQGAETDGAAPPEPPEAAPSSLFDGDPE